MRPQCNWPPDAPVYDAVLLWHLVPELAFRLGETRFNASERSDHSIAKLNDYALIQRTLSCMRQMAWSSYRDIPASRVFMNSTSEGNAVLYGLAHLARTSGQ